MGRQQKLNKYKKNKIDCLNNADALVIVTEWSEFNDFNIDKSLALMKTPIIFDGRNLLKFDFSKLNEIEYFPIGKPKIHIKPMTQRASIYYINITFKRFDDE